MDGSGFMPAFFFVHMGLPPEVDSSKVRTIEGIANPILLSLGLELVEVQLRTEPIGLVLRIIIFREGAGVSVDDCTAVSKEIGHLLEVEDVISAAYHLEVSSPGLDRPLKTERDFTRNRGGKVKITYRVDERTMELTGIIKDCQGEVLEIRDGESMQTLRLADVAKAKLVIEF